MSDEQLLAVSPIDGRYSKKVEHLRAIFSESALMRYRVITEITWLKYLSECDQLDQIPPMTSEVSNGLKKIQSDFTLEDATRIKEIESKINHDEEKGLEDHTSQCTDMDEEKDGDNGKDDDDDNSKISPDDGNSVISSWRQLLMLSSWRKPSRDDECCICLERYEPGQTICSAATDECKHVFHEDCMMHWFQDKDTCPICRTNFIEN